MRKVSVATYLVRSILQRSTSVTRKSGCPRCAPGIRCEKVRLLPPAFASFPNLAIEVDSGKYRDAEVIRLFHFPVSPSAHPRCRRSLKLALQEDATMPPDFAPYPSHL